MSEVNRPSDDSTEERVLLETVDEVVVRISKQVDWEGERLLYRLGEEELKQKQIIDFDTCFFDDSLKVQIYEKNSTAKVHQVAKVTLPLCEFIFENPEDKDEEIYPVTLVNPRTLF